MEDKTKIQLTAAEISGLWTQYINDTLSVCVNTYFLEKVEDEEVRPVIEMVLTEAKRNISMMQELFKKENFPIPVGFTSEDVNPNAPKLFSDSFVLRYLRQMANLCTTGSSAALALVTRPDVIALHKHILEKGILLQDMTREVMLKQGNFIRPPFISLPDQVEFVEKQQFLAGFFGKKRALTSIEITHLFLNIQTNEIGKAIITGFAQTAQLDEVKQFLLDGKKVAQKHLEVFSKLLMREDIPAPMSSDSAVFDTTTRVFSDKLIMFHVSGMIAAGVGNYGVAMAASPRKDIAFQYATLIPEISFYAEDGANIMIKHGWMEEPPQADDREQLIN